MRTTAIAPSTDALIAVDIQNDFCPGGALGVPDGDAVIPVINRLLSMFRVIVFSRDWHPPDHLSFSESPKFIDKSWPPHCVAGTTGAEFHPDLRIPSDVIIVSKAAIRNEEAYSAFQGTDLAEQLRRRGIRRIFIGGLATDYCVKDTTLDARAQGFEVVVISDACKGINVPDGTVNLALEAMKRSGARIVESAQLTPGEAACPRT